jgi:hypothetical protein
MVSRLFVELSRLLEVSSALEESGGFELVVSAKVDVRRLDHGVALLVATRGRFEVSHRLEELRRPQVVPAREKPLGGEGAVALVEGDLPLEERRAPNVPRLFEHRGCLR